MENIIESRSCRQCGHEFPITDSDLAFLDSISPIIAGVKLPLPAPTQCPDCRNRRRLNFRNERQIYRRRCDATGKDILSVYSPDKPYTVYEHSYWASDRWDATGYGMDFDFTRPFFEQFDELLRKVPHQSIFSVNCENSDFAQMINGKNCYLTFVGIDAQDTLYSHWMVNTKDCVDCLRCQDITASYDCTHCYSASHRLVSCFNCRSSSECSYCWNLEGCQDCFMSSNLRNKRFVFRGEQLDEQGYRLRLQESDLIDRELLKAEMRERMDSDIFRANQNSRSEECAGDFICDSKNMINSYEVSDSKDCKDFFDNAGYCTDCHDATYGWQSQKCYEVLGADGYHNLFAILNIIGTNETMYTYASYHSQDLFGCACLDRKQYCILNKQYTKQEYESLVPKIIEHMRSTGEWGEFFPASLSPFGFNESAAIDHYPISREEALRLGFNWSDYENPSPQVSRIIPAALLPSDIGEVPNDVLNWAIECEQSGRLFRIVKQELEFYREKGLPIPRKHPDIRHSERLCLRNPRKTFSRTCHHCRSDILTTFPPDSQKRIYCENCYDALMA